MATRINVTAVRDCPAAEVQDVFRQVIKLPCATECPPLQLVEHDGWVWFTTSVWGVSADDLNRGLCRLARPGLQFTTSDGDRWYLAVHGGPRGQEHFLHEFGYHARPAGPESDAEMQAQLEQEAEQAPIDPRLAFLEDDPPPGPTRPRTPFDLVADRLAVPESFRVEVAELSYSEALNRYRVWHAERVCEALAAAKIPHDPAALRAVLLWDNVTDNERGNDLGNLPRLLSVLGLGSTWDDWVRQAEAPPAPEPVEATEQATCPASPPEDRIGPVLHIVEALPLVPIAGAAVRLPLKKMPLVRFFPDACALSATAGAVISVTLPPTFERARLVLPEDSAGQVELTADGFRVGLPNHLWLGRRDLKSILKPELCNLLFDLPDGARLECAFAHESKPALNQRYHGSVAGGRWHIDATHPALAHDVLADALRLAAKADRNQQHARDEAEADAIVAAAAVDLNLDHLTVKRQGLVVSCKDDLVGNLAKLVFRVRFRDYWNVAAVEQEAAEQRRQMQEMTRQMRRASAEAARQRAAPHDADVLYKGSFSRFWRSDFTHLTELEQETRAKFDQALAGLGFQHVGDLVAKKQRDIVMRVHLAGDALCYGVLLGKRTLYLGYEFFSRFADGSLLITTTNGSKGSYPEAGIYVKVCPGLDPAQLHAKHLWALDRFRTRRGTSPMPLPAPLIDVAAESDGAMGRQAAAMAAEGDEDD